MNPGESLAAGIAALGVTVPAGVPEKLLAYVGLLAKWNRVYNLTAIRAADEMVTQHLLDSLSVLPYLDTVRTLVDVGSGAGLPGIPLALARPDLEVISVEAVGKKAAFQQQAKIELRLENFTVHGGRIETFVPMAPVDAVISRAFASLADFVRLSGHCLRPGGRLLAMKGVHPQDEIDALPAGWRSVAAPALVVPGLEARRHLIVLERS